MITTHRTNRCRIFSVLICIYMLSMNAKGAIRTFTGPGNFSDATKWAGSILPSAGDDLRIKGACTYDNSANNLVYATLQIGNGVSGSLSWPVGGTNTLNITNLSSSVGGSSLNMTNGGTIIIRGTWTSTNLSFTSGAGTIEIRSTIALPAAYATYNNLKVNLGGITVTLGVGTTINGNLNVTLGTFSIGAFSLAVTGTATVASTFTITSATGAKSFGNLVISGGTFTNTAANVPITINGNLQNDGTFSQGTGLVTFTGASNNTVTGTAVSTAFGGGITINKGASYANVLDVQCVITILSGGLTLTNGTFKISSASTLTIFTADIGTAPYLIPSTAGIWVNGGTVSTTSDVTPAGLIHVSNGTLNIGNSADERLLSSWATIIIDGGNLNISGRLTRRVTGEGQYFTMSGGTFTMPTVSSTNNTYSPFTMDDPGSSFTMSGGTIVIEEAGTSNNLGYINLAGTYNVTGGTLQIGSASTSVTDMLHIESSVPIYNLLINSTHLTAELYNQPFTVLNDVTITAGQLDANGLDLTVGGDWTNDDTFTHGNAKVTFNGTTAQSISGGVSTNFYDLTINNSYGTQPQVTVGKTANVSHTLTMSSGIVQTTATNLIAMKNGSTTTIGSSTSYIDGPMTYTKASSGASTLKLPIGASTDWRPVELTVNHSSATSYTYTASVSNASAKALGWTLPGTVTHVSDIHYWDISRSSAANLTSASVKIYYGNDDVVTDVANLTVCKNTSGAPTTWIDVNGTATGTPSGSIVSGSFSSFSRFTLGNKTGGSNPLPIELLSFEAVPESNYVLLNWSTASEINNDFFTIERSRDGINFNPIVQVKSAGNSTSTSYYSARDNNPLDGPTFYRLSQTDIDGKTVALNIISVNYNNSEAFNVYISQLNEGEINFILPFDDQAISIVITDMAGRIMFSTEQNTTDKIFAILLPKYLETGIYEVNIYREDRKYFKKIIVP